MRRWCVLCEHEIIFRLWSVRPCSRQASWWGEARRDDMYLELCPYHAKVFAAARLGDAWPIVTGDPVDDLEKALMSDQVPS